MSLPDDFPLEEAEIWIATYNILAKAGLRTVGDVRHRSDDELLAIPGIGPKHLAWIKSILE